MQNSLQKSRLWQIRFASAMALLFMLLTTVHSFAQTYIPFSGSNSMSSTGTLCTHAGCGAYYSDLANGYTVLNTASNQTVNISGSYNTESGYDHIRIYTGGNGSSGTALYDFTGNGTINFTSSQGQVVSVLFISDGSQHTYTGLNATVTFTNPLLPGDNCSNAQNLSSLSSPYSGTTVGYADDLSTCKTGAPDRIFYISVPNNYLLTIWESTNNYDEYEYLGWGGSCPGTQIECWDNDNLYPITWTNTTGSEQTAWYIQDGLSGGSGTFTLNWTLAPAAVAPGYPTSLYINPTSTSTANFGWSAGSPAGTPAPTYYWVVKNTGGTTITSGNTTYTSASVTGLTANTGYYFTVYASNSGGSSGTATSSTITTYPADPTSISGTLAICNGGSTQLTANGAQGTVYWYTGGCSNNYVGSGNSITVSPTSSTTYYARNNNGNWSAGCASGTVTVYPASVGGTATAASSTVCTGSTTTITVSSYTGSIQWQQSANGSSWSNVSGGSGATSATYTTPALYAATYYKAVVTSGVCTLANSTTASVAISPTSVGGTAAAATASLCAGSSTTVTVSGYTGTIQWQQSANGTSGWANVTGGSGATTATYTTPNLTATTYYRAALTSGVCSVATSNTATITVSPTSVGGTATAASSTVCTGSTTTITVSSYTGSIQWQQSSDGTSGWTNVSGGSGATSATYTTPALTAATYYKAVVTSGVCTLANSTTASVAISPTSVGGTAEAASTSLCAGSSTTVTVSGYTGTIQWQQSANGSSYANVSGGSGATSATYTTPNLSATTYYRAALTSGVCSVANSTPATITVSPTSVGGTATAASSTVCTGSTTTITVSSYTGSIQWQQSSDGTSGWANVSGGSGATSATYTTPTLNAAIYYKAVVTSGVCTLANSTTALVSISPTSVGGNAAAASASLCSGSNTTVTVNDYTGTIQWQQSANGTSGWANVSGGSGATTATYTTPNLSATTYYRAAITSGACSATTSNTATVTVNGLPTVAVITGTTSVCSGFTTTLSCSTAGGVWSSSNETKATVNASGVVTGVSAGTAVISYTVTNGFGCSAFSTATVSVSQSLAAPTGVTATPTSIQSGQSANLSATSVSNSIYWYAAATGGSAAGSSTSGANFSVSPSVTTTYYAEANSLQSFFVNTLTANNSYITDHNNYTGDDRGGIAITASYYYYNGDNYAVRFSMPGLTNPVSCPIRDGIFSDLGTGTLYTLHNGSSDPILNSNVSPFSVTQFRTLTTTLAIDAGAAVTLSQAVSMTSSTAAIYAGSNFVILQNGTTFYRVDIPSGTVTNMGSYTINRYPSENWATWGVAELNNGVYSVLYRERDTQYIKRLNLTTGAITNLALFTNLSDLCSFTYSTTYNRWYFHYEGTSQFGGTYETAGYADGTHTANSAGCPSASRTPVTVTVANPPTITTAAISNINATTATGGGNVTNQGGAEVTARGVCWSTSQNPTISNSHTSDGTGTGAFTSSITGLNAGTLYYVKAYATNTIGTSYGSQLSFTSYSAGTIGSTQEICKGSTPALFTSVSAPVGMPSPSYQWQSGTDNINFVDISGASASTYQPGTINVLTYFRRNAIQGSVTLSSNTIYISMAAGATPATNVTATPSTILSGQSANLNATSSGNNIYWYTAATGGSAAGSSASGANFSVSPSATTTYYAETNSIQPFYVNTLTANNSYVTDHVNYTGDDRGGIAITASYYYYNGDEGAVRYSMPGLTNPVSCPKRDGIFSDLATGTLYTLHNGSSDPILNSNVSPFSVTQFRTLTTTLAINAGAAVTLSQTVNMTSSTAAIYAGSNFVILQNGTTFYRVDIPSGTVTNMGSYTINRYPSENWATWGVAELNNGVYSVLYRERDTQYIKRLNLTTGANTNLALFTNLSDLCSFTYSTTYSRWYFHYEASAQFGGTSETAGYADGTHIINTAGCPSANRTPVTVTVANPPTITTTAISNVKATTATGGGNVTNQNGAEVTVRGVCWSTSQNPTISNSHTSDGTGTGSFISSVTGLTLGQTYYLRAYATNSMGTGYGTQVSFTTFTLGTFANINKVYGDPPFTIVNPTSPSPGAFVYESSNTNAGTISGNTLTIAGAGTSTITATQAASGSYGSSTTSCTLTVTKANQTLTLNIPTSAPLNELIGGNTLTISASSSSGLVVTISINSSSTANGTLTPTVNPGEYVLSNVGNAGTIIFDASQAGNNNYNVAGNSQNFNVALGNQEITFGALPSKTYGDIDFTTSATGGVSGNPVTFSSSNEAIATCTGANGATIHIVGAGSCLITANQAGNTSWNVASPVSQTLTISKTTTVITFADITKVYDDEPFTLSATSASTGAFTYSNDNSSVATVSGNTCTIEGFGTSTLTASQAADDNYFANTQTATLTVGQATQTISIVAIPDIYLLDFVVTPITVSASSTSGLPVTLTLEAGSVATIIGNTLTSSGATGSVTVVANQAGDANYKAATEVTELFEVIKADQSITFDALILKHVGDADFDLTAKTTSPLVITYTSSNTGVATVADITAHIAGIGTTNITATQSGNEFYNAATPVVQAQVVDAEQFKNWTGSTSTDWNVAANWNPSGVPGIIDNLIIGSAANQPHVTLESASPALCNKLNIENGATLTIDVAKALTVNSLLTNAGTIEIMSSALGTGSLITNSSIANTGTISLQRFITKDRWHLISTPVAEATSSIFNNDYLQLWSEPEAKWFEIVAPSTLLNAVEGYSLWTMKQDAFTYTFTGTPFTGNQSKTVTFTDAPFIENEGANLLGNPYPSCIDWEGLRTTYGAVYYWDGSAYLSWNNGGSGSQYIPQMQGFFIVTASDGTFSLTNANRTHNGASNYYKSSENQTENNSIVLVATSGNYQDELYLAIQNDAMEGFELKNDAWKMLSGTAGLSQLWSVCADGKLSIDVRPYQEVIQLGFTNDQIGFYTISTRETTTANNAILEDTKVNVFHNLTKGAYDFAWDPNDDETRFKLHLNAVGIQETPISESNILIYTASGQIFIKGAKAGNVIVSDIIGRVVLEQEISGLDLVSIPVNLKTGVYLAIVSSGEEVIIKKIFIK